MIDRAVGVQLSAIQTKSNLATSALEKEVERLRNEIEFANTLDTQRMQEPGDTLYSPPLPERQSQTTPPASLSESAARPSQSTARTASELLPKALRRAPSQTTADILEAVEAQQPADSNFPADNHSRPAAPTVAQLRQHAAIARRQRQFEQSQEYEREHEVYRKAEQAARRLANLERVYRNRKPPTDVELEDYSPAGIRRMAASADRDFAMQDAISKARREAAEARQIAELTADISRLRRELAAEWGGL